MPTLGGDAAKTLIRDQIRALSQGVDAALAPFEPRGAVAAWHSTLRAMEEFLNVLWFGVEDPRQHAGLQGLRLDESLPTNPDLKRQLARLATLYDSALAGRFQTTLLQLSTLNLAFRHHAFELARDVSLSTVGGAAAYLQSRRRHFVALLYSMPRACRGVAPLDRLDTLNQLAPLVEHSCLNVTGLHQQLVLATLFRDFELQLDATGFQPNRSADLLEQDFLEPERASIVALLDLRPDGFAPARLEPQPRTRIFSAPELRNAVRSIASAYDAYGLNDDAFRALCRVVFALSRATRDDYELVVQRSRLETMLHLEPALEPETMLPLLIHASANYAAATNGFQPFVQLGDTLIGNVNLLSRFLYALKNVHLKSRKRFTIHSGFIFEDMVKRDLRAWGFDVADVRRINRKEFDVVASKRGRTYNLQCKNNWIDLAKIEAEPLLFARYNRRLERYYRGALVKEAGREHLLQEKLGADVIQHRVVSRFPVVSDDPRIVPYNKLRERLSHDVGGA